MAGTWGDLNNVANAPGGIFNRMTTPANPVARPTPKATNTPTGPAPYTGGGDLWERIQNETRRGARSDEWSTMEPLNHATTYHLGSKGDARSLSPEQQRVFDQYGIKASYSDPYMSGPKGESGLVEMEDGKWGVDGLGSYDRSKMPKTVFGHDFRQVTERDKGLIPREDAIVWDDNYGWITHEKNYNQNGNESWFMQNAKTIMPALFTMGLGAAGVAPGVLSGMSLGRGAVDYLGGNRSMQSLLPQLISAGLPFIPGFGDLGRLAQGLTRAGTGFFSNMLLNNNRGGRG